MSQSPSQSQQLTSDHPYAQSAAQLNRLIRAGNAFSGHERNCFYLNIGDGTFANVSSVSGVDFAEDGRAVAQADWDFDGDVDLWIANRTSPQIRFLRNELSNRDRHFMAFRLVGTRSNRDAIGASVYLNVQGPSTALQRSVRAGEGYLAQSSKWVHFGIGTATQLDRLTVRWPDGVVEAFSLPESVDAFFELVEGSGVAVRWTPPETRQVPSTGSPENSPEGLETHNWLTETIPLPPLYYSTPTGQTRDATISNGKPFIVSLWATWCAACQPELRDWAKNESRLHKSGADVLLISIDKQEQSSTDSIRAHLEKMGVRFDFGFATESLLNCLQHVHDSIYDHHRPLPVPTTLLIDQNGFLNAIYKGPVDTDRLLFDIARLRSTDSRIANGLPFEGKWINPPQTARVSKIAIKLWEDGLIDEAKTFTERLTEPRFAAEQAQATYLAFERLKSTGKLNEAVKILQQALAKNPNDAECYFRLGTLLLSQNQHAQAAKLLDLAREHSIKPRADVLANLGATLRLLGNTDAASKYLLDALDIDHDSFAAHVNLGLIRAEQTRFEEAANHFTQAVRLQPDAVNHRVNLSMALVQLRRPQDALRELKRALQSDPESIVVLIYLGEIYVELGDTEKAIATFTEVVRKKPKAGRIWMRLARLHDSNGDAESALAAYERVNQGKPNDPIVLARMAWWLSTAADPKLIDGTRALKLAKESVELTNRTMPDALDALAAAYAVTGRFDDATETIREAITLIPSDTEQRRAILKEMEARLAGYQNQKPFRSNENTNQGKTNKP